MAKALPAHQKQEGLFVCRASSRPHGGGRLLSAAAVAAVAAAAIVVAVKAGQSAKGRWNCLTGNKSEWSGSLPVSNGN